MEVIEDGNIMDRIPILLQRDLEYYQASSFHVHSFFSTQKHTKSACNIVLHAEYNSK